MTKEQAQEMLILLKRIAEGQEGIAIELSFFQQRYWETQSFPRDVREVGRRG